MKKLSMAAVCLCMAAALSACGDYAAYDTALSDDDSGTVTAAESEFSAESEPSADNTDPKLEPEVKNVIEGCAEFSLFKVHTTGKISASIGESVVYNNSNDGETYVDVVIDFTNMGTEAVSVRNLFKISAEKSDGTEYTDYLCAAETNNATSMSKFENIAPLASSRIHCAVSVPEGETELLLKLMLGDSTYTVDYTVGTLISCAKPIKEGDTAESGDYASMRFAGYEFTDDVLPSDTSGVYSHYEVDNPANTYLVLKFDVTNLMTDEKRCDTFLGAKAQFMGKYVYSGFTVAEDEDKRGFSRHEQLLPLTERRIYCLIEVPDTVAGTDMTVTVSFGGREYVFSAAKAAELPSDA